MENAEDNGVHPLYLKALEIQGFKSFPDKTVLSFGSDITAIVGPNGSGKSNIADAIRWVMGEQSTRTLRGNKMEDVIFDGTARRKGLGFAEVTLVLDNSDHILLMEESEVAVTRRYFRSGESEYYINRRACRLRDINDLFMDTGLGREGYSIIGQGRIDEILSLKSADRREIFEEAAGISRFRHRKEEAERRLTRTDENLVRINDKIDELKLQVEPLQAAAEKTKKFLTMAEELKGLEISVWLAELERLRASAIRLRAELDGAIRQREQAKEKLEGLYAAGENYAQQIRERDMSAEELRARQSGVEEELHRCENGILLLKNDIKNNMENAVRIKEEMEQQQGRAGSIAQQIVERQARLGEIEGEMAACQEEMDLLAQKMEEAIGSAGVLSQELERLQQRAQLERASAGEAKELMAALAAAAQELLDREEKLGQELQEQEERMVQVRQVAQEMKRELDRVTEDRDAVRNVISGYQMRQQSRRRKLEEAQEKHRRLQMDEGNLKGRIKLLAEMEKMYEGYSKAVKLVMGEAERGTLSGICGPVAGLLHVPDQYAVAIEIALGSAMQNIVVERDEDGKDAIQWLKRRDGGRATFLPMNTIRPSSFKDKGVEQEEGFVGFGDTLITFDKIYTDIFSYLLGRVVIAQDLNLAMRMARKFGHRFRIVTLDGQVLSAGGSMTGGSASRSAGILSRANELERLEGQRKGLEKDLEAVEEELSTAQRGLTAAEYELETAAAQLREAEDAVLKYSERAQSALAQMTDVNTRHQALQEERAQVRRRMEENAASTSQARSRMEELEGTAAALRAESEAKAEGRSALQDRVAQLNSQAADQSARLAGLDGERAASRQTLEELERLQSDLSEDWESRMAMAAQFEENNSTLMQRIEGEELRAQKLRADSLEGSDSLRRLNQEKLELEGKRNQTEKEAREQNGKLLNMEREVSLLEQKSVSATMEENQLLDRLWESYQMSHEAARAQQRELDSLPKAQRRIAELKRAIAALGSVNPDAVEEFQRVNERYTMFTGQRDDVTQAKRELEGIITQITGEMTSIFQRQFALINEMFQQTFQELFGGGRASLELEDLSDVLNCGIEIRVQPPGKALKIISLLSGGERAFVAIALYFAILKVRPTPFCVMDEIEAALDDPNVSRFAGYMRKISAKTQFIVITHRRGTMEEADVLYGVTMQEQGVSRMLSINLNEVEKELNIR